MIRSLVPIVVAKWKLPVLINGLKSGLENFWRIFLVFQFTDVLIIVLFISSHYSPKLFPNNFFLSWLWLLFTAISMFCSDRAFCCFLIFGCFYSYSSLATFLISSHSSSGSLPKRFRISKHFLKLFLKMVCVFSRSHHRNGLAFFHFC